jgi:putative ABC transport system permease protein
MMRPRWRKVLADLHSNPVRSFLAVASITVGLFAIGVISILYYVIRADMRDGYAAVNPANVQLVVSGVNQDFVDHIGRMQGVKQVEGVRSFGLRMETGPGEWLAFSVKAIPDIDQMQINQVRLEEGGWPPADDQMVLERYKLADTHARVGDTLRVELPSGKIRPIKVVGVVNDQTLGAFSGGGGFFLAPVQAYVTQDTLQWLEQSAPDIFNILYVTVDGDKAGGGKQNEAYLWSVADRVRDEVEKNGVEVISVSVRSSYDHPNRIFVDAISGVLLMLGMFVVFLSGFLITNTLQALLNQQIQQIGIMKTIGARRLQITSVYMTLIFFFGLLAVAISLPLAFQVAFKQAQSLSDTINFNFRGQRFVPQAVILQVAIALIVPQLAAILPILQGVRISVQEALSGIRQDGAAARGWLDQLLARIKFVSRPTLISIRNTFRRKGRLLLTLLTLTLGGAIFIASFNVQVSMGNYVDQISQYFLADVNLNLDRPYRTTEINDLIMQVPGVERVEGWATARSEILLPDGSVGDSVQLLAPPGDSQLIHPVLLGGRWVLPADENAIVLNERFMNRFPDLKPGDTLRLQVNGKETRWVVVGFFQLAGNSSGYLAYANYHYLSQVIHQPNKAATYRIVANQPDLSLDQQQQLGRAIEAQLSQRGIHVTDLTAGLSLSETAGSGFSTLTTFLLFLAILTALVGSIGLAGTMSMNVMERTREIGIMRAIGASNAILTRMVIFEGMLIGLISWLLGTLLAFPISILLSETISQSLFQASTDFGFTPTGFILWLVAVILLSALASVIPARNASRLTIREVLAYE